MIQLQRFWQNNLLVISVVILVFAIFAKPVSAQNEPSESQTPSSQASENKKASQGKKPKTFIDKLDLIFSSERESQSCFKDLYEDSESKSDNPLLRLGSFGIGKVSMLRYAALQTKRFTLYYMREYDQAFEASAALLEFVKEKVLEPHLLELAEVEYAVAQEILKLDQEKQRAFSHGLAVYKLYSTAFKSARAKDKVAVARHIIDVVTKAREELVQSVGEENWYTLDATEFLFQTRREFDETFVPDPDELEQIVKYRLEYPMVTVGNTQLLQTQLEIANLERNRGEFEKAAVKLQEIVDVAKANGQSYLYQLARTAELAAILEGVGRVHRARALVVELSDNMPSDFVADKDYLNFAAAAGMYIKLGNLHMACGDGEAARVAWEKGMDTLAKLETLFDYVEYRAMIRPFVTKQKTVLANGLSQIGENVKAEKLLEEAIGPLVEESGVKSQSYTNFLVYRAKIYSQMGRFQSAIEQLLEAIESHKAADVIQEVKNFRLIKAYGLLARARRGALDFEGAQAEFERAEQLLISPPAELKRMYAVARTEILLSSIENLRKLKRHSEAVEQSNELLAMSQEILPQAFFFKNFQEAKRDLGIFKGALDHLLATADMSDPMERERALKHSIEIKSQLFTSLRRREKLMRAIDQSENEGLRQDFLIARSQFASSLFNRISSDEAYDPNQIFSAESHMKGLLQRLPLHLKDEPVEKNLSENMLADLAKNLPGDVAFVEVIRNQRLFDEDLAYRPGYQAFVFFRQADELQIRFVDLGKADSIDRDISSWIRIWELQAFGNEARGIKRKKTGENSVANVGERLLKNVWKQLEPEFGGRTKIAIVGEGELRRLPWSTLPNGKLITLGDGSKVAGCVIDEFEVFTLPSTAEFLRSQSTKRVSTGKVAYVADVDYGPLPNEVNLEPSSIKRFQNWEPLPSSKPEVDAFSRCLGNQKRVVGFTGQKASEEQFLKQLGQFDVVHIATHGFSFLPGDVSAQDSGEDSRSDELKDLVRRNPWALCGLAFANANVLQGKDPTADGLVFGEEIVGCSLENLKLVVLSACSTGTGIVYEDMNVHGIQQAFLFAGAQSTIGSFWPVQDEKTTEFMTLFYDGLAKQRTVSEALREAQLAFRQKGEPLSVWGAWMVSGDWQVRIRK